MKTEKEINCTCCSKTIRKTDLRFCNKCVLNYCKEAEEEERKQALEDVKKLIDELIKNHSQYGCGNHVTSKDVWGQNVIWVKYIEDLKEQINKLEKEK